jgi:proteasome lid subunit RPN8/RPN11
MKSIVDHANTSEQEVCGFILVDDGNLKSEPAQNVAVYKNDVFEIHPLEILKKIKSGKLAAIYHTHPVSGEAESKFDKFNCENCCIPFVIYSKQNQKFNLILPKTVHVNKEYVTILKNNYD